MVREIKCPNCGQTFRKDVETLWKAGEVKLLRGAPAARRRDGGETPKVTSTPRVDIQCPCCDFEFSVPVKVTNER